MKEEIAETQGFIKLMSDAIHIFIRENITTEWYFQIVIKFFLVFGVSFLLDIILKFFVQVIFKRFKNGEKYPLLKSVYESKFINSFVHFLVLIFARFALRSLYEGIHNDTFKITHTLVSIIIVVILAGMGLRFLKAIEYYFFYTKDYYKIVALRAVTQTLKILGIVILLFVLISLIFDIKGTAILGSLGAMTAIILLVFRDTILGFVTGIHVATSESLKENDWIGIPKYNLEGTIESIGLLTTKIQGFDKTISTIPTYDLLSTEIRNLQVMSETNTRRIKKSIIFNIKSFKFLSEEMLERFSKVNYLKDYLEEKRSELAEERMKIPNPDEVINGQHFTNIGMFRIYAFNYLKNNPNIDQEGTLMVRQLEITSQGLPLEIYAFANDSKWENFEKIQADIFDHLLVVAHEFDLEIMQVNVKI